ncbi:MAG: bifunctional 3,4-dihydroxy-2-butanone-4-phosphate synthase/GTP cyclohydrolase II [Acidobacteria bacterium]|nr:bifunctional 3,4-dihydroxy-2-butanone-4-phosphate synthase/GTP cyclohydrolase II [Acidobacteriota bacterium]NIM62071.1 bifunctional 3,4-dihydroxy-2-butanone-4-phosphate synthase/GTP cyclohydrolase II [Acidobacteriota bacterium]NIO59720.1 bifunctional 3,4-dihydroxy-2-butanone-4-phosphate synthase/GTP cyclohydrolase II [Acidobacteriota bacterium]NIQ30809.1 bifunctional 3,4-dihydroxy-2-butanone-4-phosphate synthase/GTP cyclohydrolase II [Acidobacteriota bacterium]NIQ85871.1 bifunctional 3,4-dih
MSKRPDGPFATIEEAIEEIRQGRMIIALDDEDRENEGDLVCAAEDVTPEIVNFMATHGRGLVCMPMTPERLDELEISEMVEKNTARRGTAFCVSIEARRDITTGISAADRAHTIRLAVNPETRPEDLARPGHVFPLRARPGGVLKRAGHTEASVDLCRLAGLRPAAVICEIMNEDGSMARLDRLEPFAREHGLKMISIADLIAYRMRNERLVKRVASPELPTDNGNWRIHAFHYELENLTHVAMVLGDPQPDDAVLVRVHSQCLTGDVFGSTRCDCGPQLHEAMERIAKEGKGAILYLRQEGRGIGLANKLRAYELQDTHQMDTVQANIELGFEPDHRNYGVGAQILYDLGIRRLRLMTNNMGKYVALKGYGLELVERVPIELPPSESNRAYLEAKKIKMGHLLKSV